MKMVETDLTSIYLLKESYRKLTFNNFGFEKKQNA